MNNKADRERMDIVIAGHVDHGKSTVIGRLLADTRSLPEGKLEQIKLNCERNAKPFEYAFLLDALKDEQSQGITIDAARVFFKTAKRDYIIIDAPGHIEFLKNMVTGASRAQAALLVIDAEEGVRENSRRHGYLCSMLGIRRMVVLVNKMDLAEYSRETFDAIVSEYRAFLSEIGLECPFIPVSGREGDNIAHRSEIMSWYDGPTVLEAIDAFAKEPKPVDKPFRMPVQDIYKFTQAGDKRRIVVGTIDAGRVRAGDEVIFFPSNKRSRVQTLEVFNRPAPEEFTAGQACGFTLEEQIYIGRGEIAALEGAPEPEVTSRFRGNLFWMGRTPLVKHKDYMLKIGTAKVLAQVEDVVRVIDGSNLSAAQDKDRVEYHDVAECIFSAKKAIAFDLADVCAPTGRFVIVDDYEIRGGGIIREALPDEQLHVRDQVMLRNYKWEVSRIARDDRAERYNQKAALVLVTGGRQVGKKTLAKTLEARLFQAGKIVYFIGIGNILYGVDADIKQPGSDVNRAEHLRRMAEVVNLMLDAGMILVVTATDLTGHDLDIIRAAVDTDLIHVVWLGPETSDIDYDVLLPERGDLDDAVAKIKTLLQDRGCIFRP